MVNFIKRVGVVLALIWAVVSSQNWKGLLAFVTLVMMAVAAIGVYVASPKGDSVPEASITILDSSGRAVSVKLKRADTTTVIGEGIEVVIPPGHMGARCVVFVDGEASGYVIERLMPGRVELSELEREVEEPFLPVMDVDPELLNGLNGSLFLPR